MLDAHVDALLDDAAANFLVELHTESALGHVPHNTSLTMVELVGHTLVNGTITNNIDDLAELVVGQVLLEANGTIGTERLLAEVTGASSVTERVRHASLK